MLFPGKRPKSELDFQTYMQKCISPRSFSESRVKCRFGPTIAKFPIELFKEKLTKTDVNTIYFTLS